MLFGIVLLKKHKELAERIEVEYPNSNHYKVSDSYYLVHADSLSDHVATQIGVKGDDKVEGASGVVFKLNGAYSGWAPRSLWEWLEIVEDAI